MILSSYGRCCLQFLVAKQIKLMKLASDVEKTAAENAKQVIVVSTRGHSISNEVHNSDRL